MTPQTSTFGQYGKTRLLALLFLVGSVSVSLSSAQTAIDPLLQSLRSNVVRVTAVRPSGEKYDGFGFIVGEQGNTLYVVTANHVVRSNEPDGTSKEVLVTFFSQQGLPVKATLLETSDLHFDLAVIQVEKPRGFSWRRDALGQGGKRGTNVWILGRDRDWDWSAQPGQLRNPELDSTIRLENLDVRVGSSGAPLISQNGIIGIVVSDEARSSSFATPIEKIREAIQSWNRPFMLERSVAADLPPPPDHGSVARSLEELRPRVKAGQTVVVTDDRGHETKGTIAAISPSSLELSVHKNRLSFADNNLSEIIRPDSVVSGAVIGAVVAAGLVVGSLMASEQYNSEGSVLGQTCYNSCTSLIVRWAAVGAGIGIGLDALGGPKTLYRRSPSNASSLTISWSPFVRNGGPGAKASVRFGWSPKRHSAP